MRWDVSFKRQQFVLRWFQNHLILKLWLTEIWSLKVPVRAIKFVECTNYFGLMGMPSNFPLGQLSSPTTGIFPGQAPALGVYTSISTAAPSVWGLWVVCPCKISAMNVCIWCKLCVTAVKFDILQWRMSSLCVRCVAWAQVCINVAHPEQAWHWAILQPSCVSHCGSW